MSKTLIQIKGRYH